MPQKKIEFPFSSFYIALLFTSILIVLLAYGEIHLAAFISDIICFSYPAYMSVEAIARKNDPLKDQMLIYWCLFACFVVLEPFQELLVSLLRTYYLMKTLFLVWCFLPVHNNGARFAVHVAPVLFSGISEMFTIITFYADFALRSLLAKTGQEKKFEQYLGKQSYGARNWKPTDSKENQVSNLVRNFSCDDVDERKKEE